MNVPPATLKYRDYTRAGAFLTALGAIPTNPAGSKPLARSALQVIDQLGSQVRIGFASKV
jgi:hypothetical protein